MLGSQSNITPHRKNQTDLPRSLLPDAGTAGGTAADGRTTTDYQFSCKIIAAIYKYRPIRRVTGLRY